MKHSNKRIDRKKYIFHVLMNDLAVFKMAVNVLKMKSVMYNRIDKKKKKFTISKPTHTEKTLYRVLLYRDLERK